MDDKGMTPHAQDVLERLRRNAFGRPVDVGRYANEVWKRTTVPEHEYTHQSLGAFLTNLTKRGLYIAREDGMHFVRIS